MRFAIIVALFVILGLFLAERSLPGHAECLGAVDSCLVLPLDNPLRVRLLFPTFSNYKGHVTVTLYCEVQNPTDTLQPIDLRQFRLTSGGEMQFKSFTRKKKLADTLAIDWVPAGAQEDHVVEFISTEKYTKLSGDRYIKANRFFLLRQKGTTTDSLFAVLYGHRSRPKQ